MDHPNCMKIYYTAQDHKYCLIFTEVMEGGELFDEFVNRVVNRGKFGEDDAAYLLKNVLGCINYCHGLGIAHRDLKPENIMLEKHKKLENIKIIDFGLAKHFEKAGDLKTTIGTEYYAAPEVFKGDYDEKCDIWSIGVIAYVILLGKFPFKD